MENAVFGQAGKQVLIEQFLVGEELTIMAFTDGKTVVPMPPAQDHKRVGNGDTGLNTGGMGAYAPAPLGTAELKAQVTREVLQPMVDAMVRLGSDGTSWFSIPGCAVRRTDGGERNTIRVGVQCTDGRS